MQEDPKDILELNYLENKKLLKHINYDNYMKIVSNIIEKQPIKVYVSYDATVRCLLRLIEL